MILYFLICFLLETEDLLPGISRWSKINSNNPFYVKQILRIKNGIENSTTNTLNKNHEDGVSKK